MPRSQDRPRAVTMSERLAQVEQENQDLHARLAELTDAAARNEALLRKTQGRELDLLRAGSLVQLLERLIHGLRTAYQLDAIALLLRDPQHEIRHLLAGDGFPQANLREVLFVDTLVNLAPQLAALERPWLGPYRIADHELLVPHARALGSLALLPLARSEQLEGVLVFGSIERTRFTPELASDFLAHLGTVASVCVENAVNRARLVRSGLTDFLTGFNNRRYLQARLCEELARAQREREGVVCLMIDVDHFKRINDQFGHLAGDAVLREVAQRIDSAMRVSDTGARFGGDEFAIVLPSGTLEDGATVARRVLQAVRGTPIVIAPGVAETITLSIGVARALPDPDTRDFKSLAERLMAEADAALYRAKGAGRNGVSAGQALIA
jgi:two-component system, cell cycle response regulator